MANRKSVQLLEAETKRLGARLEEAEGVLGAIRENQVGARVFIESMNHGIVIMSPEGTILHCNMRFSEILQTPLERIIGASFFDMLTPPRDGKKLQGTIKTCGPEGCKGEFRLRTSKRKRVSVQLSAGPLTGTTEIFCVVITDLAELKRAEEALKEVNEELEQQVGNRTAELEREIIERRQAEDELGRTNRQLAFILANSLDAAYERNIQTDRYEYMSPVVQKLTGFSSEEMMSLGTNDMLALVHPDDLPRVKAEKRNSSSEVGEETGMVEYRFRSKNGKYRWLSDRFSIVRDGEGHPLYRVGIVRDITGRKKNEEELRRSRDELELRVQERTAEVRRALEAAAKERQRLYDVLEALPVMICLLTPDYHVAFANRSFREKFGEPEGRHCHDFCFGNKQPCEFCESYEVLKTGKPHHWVVKSPDGGTVIDAYDFPFTDIDGSPLILEMDIDITDQRRAETTLKAAAAYGRSLIEASIDPLVTIDSRGMISDVNIATEHITGYPREKLIGTDFSDYFTDPEKASAGYQLVFREGTVRDYELVIRHKDGHTTPVLYNASVYKDDAGNVMGVFAAARDISEQRRLEDHLRHAQKMEALGTLTGGIAHDFNNILAAILGFAEMSLEDVPRDTPLEKNLRHILQSSLRGRDLIKQMLTFSRKSEYEVKPMPITPLVKETAKLLRASIPTTVEIEVETSATWDVVEANATGVQQILMNLCTNAAYAMRETGGELKITLSDTGVGPDSHYTDLAPGPYVRLAVSDRGTGMDDTVRKRIFEPFFTTKGPGEGTGMGLAVVYGIVKSLKGEITVESVPGKGSTFQILIPKVAAHEETVPSSCKEAARGKERVLFIDDENIIAELGRAMLERLGYQVTATTDAEEALKIFSEDPSAFDLIVTDQTMPLFTGVRLAKEVFEMRPDIPVILCTGYSESSNRDTAKAAGITDLLMKPLAWKELAQAVREALDMGSRREQPRQSRKKPALERTRKSIK